MSYPPRKRRQYDSDYHAPAMLPPHVRLPNGTVGCISCHDLYATKQELLTVTTNASKLCFTCHAMD